MNQSTSPSPRRGRRREYDIVRRDGDQMHAIYRFMACPVTPPLMSTPTAAEMHDFNTGKFEPKLIHIHRRWMLVNVRRSFKAALKWVRQQQEEQRNVQPSAQ